MAIYFAGEEVFIHVVRSQIHSQRVYFFVTQAEKPKHTMCGLQPKILCIRIRPRYLVV